MDPLFVTARIVVGPQPQTLGFHIEAPVLTNRPFRFSAWESDEAKTVYPFSGASRAPQRDVGQVTSVSEGGPEPFFFSEPPLTSPVSKSTPSSADAPEQQDEVDADGPAARAAVVDVAAHHGAVALDTPHGSTEFRPQRYLREPNARSWPPRSHNLSNRGIPISSSAWAGISSTRWTSGVWHVNGPVHQPVAPSHFFSLLILGSRNPDFASVLGAWCSARTVVAWLQLILAKASPWSSMSSRSVQNISSLRNEESHSMDRNCSVEVCKH